MLPPSNAKPKLTFFKSVSKSRKSVADNLSDLFSARQIFTQDEIDELQDTLILSDIGVDASEAIIAQLTKKLKTAKLSGQQIRDVLHNELIGMLSASERALDLTHHPSPAVILMVGVNGVGKTTTCAKIAHHLKGQGDSVMLAACDTYRAAAIEQLQMWGTRLNIPVIAQSSGADPAAVAHDAMHAATARGCTALLIDTAGRQQTRNDLMRQLNKIQRVISKIEPSAPHETLITIDAGTGQNAIAQVREFNNHTPITGICLSKLDGTAKGGIVVALGREFALPIAFIGLGESLADIAPFKARDYAASLLADESPDEGQ